MKVIKLRQSVLVVVLGLVFEHFDMMLASLLASAIVAEFIGGGNSSYKLLYAYIGYAIAFLFRPLGALCFGCFGDLYGRKTALMSSMALMSVATLSLAFIPGVTMIGPTATFLFFLCRIAQGFAVGGEYGTAITYAFELNSDFRTFYGACVVSSTHVGGLLASLLASQSVENFRTAFFIAGLAGLLLLLFRSFMNEYYVPLPRKITDIATESVKDKKSMLKALVIASMLVLVFYGSLIYLNELLYQDFNINRSDIFKANSFLLTLWIVLPPCIGYIVDKMMIPYHNLMRLGAIGVFLTAPLLGAALTFYSYPVVLASQMMLHICHMLFCLCTPRFFGELFSNQARNTSISLSYSLGASLTAALAPMICYVSISVFHTYFAICLPFMLVALMAIFILKKENICSKMTHLSYTT